MPKAPLRFAIIGAGHIAQSAVIPAFSHPNTQATLTAMLSDDEEKRRQLSRRHHLIATWPEAALDEALRSDVFDALYIATPNHLHLAQASAALRAGIHVLLEKPLTVDEAEAKRLLRLAEASSAKLMVAYRLHCDPFYVGALQRVRDGAIGEPRFMTASFSMQLTPGNVRSLPAAKGGGPLHDLGIYCINAARSLFRSEPLAVQAMANAGHDRRSQQVAEMVSVTLRFPGGCLASFTVSFAASSTGWYQIVGTTGSLCLDTAFNTSGTRTLEQTTGGRTRTSTQAIGDQFAAEIAYFTTCVRQRRIPEPGVHEGLRDMRVVDAIRKALSSGKTVPLMPLPSRRGARKTMTSSPPRPRTPRLIHVVDPSTSA